MLFRKKFLLEVLEDYGSTSRIVSNNIIGTRRWSTDLNLVFKHEGKFYQTTYSVGSTECQDERPFDYDPDDIECPEVVPVEKTVIVYEPIKGENHDTAVPKCRKAPKAV